MTENLKPSLGVWDWDDETGNIRIYAGDKLIADLFDPPDGDVADAIEWSSNADLVVEAGNTFQQCGLSPLELLDGYRELRKALMLCRFDSLNMTLAEMSSFRSALAKHKEV